MVPRDERAKVHAGNDAETRTLPRLATGLSGLQGRRKCILLFTVLKSHCTVQAAGCLHYKRSQGFALRKAHCERLCTAAQLAARSAAPEHHARNWSFSLTRLGKNFSTSSQRRRISLAPKMPSNSGNKLVHYRKASAKPKHRLVASKGLGCIWELLQLPTPLNTDYNRNHALRN